MNRFLCRSSQWIERERTRPVAYIVQRGERMPVTREGFIARQGSKAFSGQWRMTGAVTRNNFGAATRRYGLAEILADPSAIPWQHANGKQRTFITDLDHGSYREWCSPAAWMVRA